MTDSVFTRSFSALLAAGILAKDAELLVLNDDRLQAFFQKIGRYLLLEKIHEVMFMIRAGRIALHMVQI